MEIAKSLNLNLTEAFGSLKKMSMTGVSPAEVLFGRKKVESMLTAFKEADTDKDGKVAATEIGNLMRSQGLAPSEKQVAEYISIINREGGFFVPLRFLEICVQCGRNDTRLSDFLEFFAPYDPSGTGKLSVTVFRNLMENVGEVFKRSEVDELVRDFAKNDVIEYRQMLQT